MTRGIIRPTREPKHAGRLDRDEVRELADAELTYEDVAELAEVTASYVHRFERAEGEPEWPSDWVLRQWHPTAELEARRAWVATVEGIWRARRRRPGGAYFNRSRGRHGGPVIRLLLHLLTAAGEGAPVAPATLYHDLAVLAGGKRP